MANSFNKIGQISTGNAKLDEVIQNLQIWERGFEIEWKRSPTKEDISNRPNILALYKEKASLEKLPALVGISGLRIHRAGLINSSSLTIKSVDLEYIEDKPQIAVEETKSSPSAPHLTHVSLFDDESSFASYYGDFEEKSVHKTDTSPEVKYMDENSRFPSNFNIQPSSTETALKANFLKSLLFNSTSTKSHNEYGEHESTTHMNGTVEGTNQEQKFLVDSSATLDDHTNGTTCDDNDSEMSNISLYGSDISINESVSINDEMELDELLETLGANETSHIQLESSMLLDDAHLTENFVETDLISAGDGENSIPVEPSSQPHSVMLPGSLSLKSFGNQFGTVSLAKSLKYSKSLEIVEEEASKLCFEDELIEAELANDSSTIQATSSSRIKRKRADTNTDQLQADIDAEDTNFSSNKKAKTKESFGGSKRQNFRKMNLKHGYKKPKMDRDMMAIARARKAAASFQKSLQSSELTPYDLLDEATLENIVDSPSINPSNTIENDGEHTMEAPDQNPGENEVVDFHSFSADCDDTLYENLLKSKFKLNAFRQGQLEAIKAILRGQNCLLILPTGGGKSLCYQYPTFLFPTGITLVVSPLLSLMTDQLSKLPKGLVGVSLNSTQTKHQFEESMQKLVTKKANILFISPEKLSSQTFLNTLKQLKIEFNFVCVDEAHCISTWSHNFRPSYLTIYKYAVETLKSKCVLALTATATKETEQSICSELRIPAHNVIRFDPIANHLKLHIVPSNQKYSSLPLSSPYTKQTPITQNEKHDELEKILRRYLTSGPPDQGGTATPSCSIIIYVMFQHHAEDLALFLLHKGFSCASYHAGKPPKERLRIQNLFFSGFVQIIVATVAFGMGIDKKDVRVVVHFSMPKSIENYVQEVGRAGRDGIEAHCYLMASYQDYSILRSLAHADSQDRVNIKQLILDIWPLGRLANSHKSQSSKAESSTTSNNASSAFLRTILLPVSESEQKYDMKASVMNTILTWLSVAGKIRVRSQNWSVCNISFLETSMDSLKSTSQLIKHCSMHGTKSKGILSVDLLQLANTRRQSLAQVISDLHHAETHFKLSLQFHSKAHVIEVLEELLDSQLDECIDSISSKCKQLEQISLTKLEDMSILAFNDSNGDSENFISERVKNYFSSSGNPSLSSSVKGSPNMHYLLSKSVSDYDQNALSNDLKVFLAQYGDAISTARQLTRIFHGIASPKFPKEEWHKNPFWSKWTHLHFASVLQVAQEQLIAFKTCISTD